MKPIRTSPFAFHNMLNRLPVLYKIQQGDHERGEYLTNDYEKVNFDLNTTMKRLF